MTRIWQLAGRSGDFGGGGAVYDSIERPFPRPSFSPRYERNTEHFLSHSFALDISV